jgi:hypothetical protein
MFNLQFRRIKHLLRKQSTNKIQSTVYSADMIQEIEGWSLPLYSRGETVCYGKESKTQKTLSGKNIGDICIVGQYKRNEGECRGRHIL